MSTETMINIDKANKLLDRAEEILRYIVESIKAKGEKTI